MSRAGWRVGFVALLLVLGTGRAFAETAFAQGLLWRISRAGTPDSFVFGTLHLSDPRVSRIGPELDRALSRSRVFAAELVMETLADPRLADLERLPPGQTLRTLLGEPLYAQVRATLLAQGTPESVVEHLKPWAALLAVARAPAPAEGVALDSLLLREARRRGMRLAALEWIDEQVAAFDGVPVETQIALLAHAVGSRDALVALVEPTIEAWLARDLDRLMGVARRAYLHDPAIERHYLALVKHVIDDRTALLHHRLVLPLRAGRVFVAVGATHLPGERGLLRLLEGDGYRIERLW